MSSSLVLKVASLTSTKTFKLTDAQVAAALRLFIEGWASPPPEGATQAEINQFNLDQANERIRDMIVEVIQPKRIRQLKAEQPDVIAQAISETNL